MINKKYTLILLITLLLSSCETLIDADKASEAKKYDFNKPHFSFVFSHSLMGETHPCGCRQFPLGGLPQVAGLFNNLKKEKEIFYVDTGDAFFPSSVVPELIKDSLSFAALNLAKGLDNLGLKYMLIGDQDLAMGWDFLRELKKSVKFDFLLSNLSDEKTIEHKTSAVINFGEKKIFLFGIVDPESLLPEYSSDFISPDVAIPNIIKKLKDDGYDPKNPNHMLVMLSHSGMQKDTQLAKNNSDIDWIIGSHSQSFTNFTVDIGKTKIVQVLSKNHYIGEIKIENTEKIENPFKYHEIRDELKDNIEKNPFSDFIIAHKAQMDKIRTQEQKRYSTTNSNFKDLATAKSCLECHQDKKEHWQKSPHSIAFGTLINHNESNNNSCIGCHSLGLGKEGGFINFTDIVKLEDQSKIDNYWGDVKKVFSGVKSVRGLKPNEILKINQDLDKISLKHKEKVNFSNVQCLNCHNQHLEHPFSVGEGAATKEARKESIVSNCLGCHTKDQSPEWYNQDERGMSQDVNKEKIMELYKKMSH